jgi:hypothetical protein
MEKKLAPRGFWSLSHHTGYIYPQKKHQKSQKYIENPQSATAETIFIGLGEYVDRFSGVKRKRK